MTAESARPLILITGATGFVGARIVQQLYLADQRIRTSARRASPHLPLTDFRSVDLSDRSAVASLVKGTEIIIHTAGLTHGYGVAKHPDAEYWRINAGGTENLVRAAAAEGCRRFVLVSSISVYGRQQPPYIESARCFPHNVYAKSKLAAEQLAAQITKDFAMELVILRMAPICGEGARGNIERLIRAVDRRRFIWIGKGSNLKSLISVEDAASACIAAASADRIGQGGVYNVAAPAATMRSIVSTIANALGQTVPRVCLPERIPWHVFNGARRIPIIKVVTQPAFSILDKWLADEIYECSNFQQHFFWHPKVNIQEALVRQVQWYRGSLGQYA